MMQRREFLGYAVRTAVTGGAALATGRYAWPSGTARRASVTDFGADATGQKDSTAAVQRAIASLAQRNARLVFPSGKYSFAASNTALMDFSAYEGLEIFGNGAELSFSGGTQPLRMTGCKDIEVHDIIVDWPRLPCSAAGGGTANAAAALHLNGCEQILLETIAFHASPGMAVFLYGCREITLDTLRVMPHPGSGRTVSSCGGGVGMLDCWGTITMQHATISGTLGAGMRVQQSYWAVSEVIDPQSAMLASSDGKPVPEWLLPVPGTFMQLSEAGTLRLLGEIAVIKSDAAPGGMRLTFAETLSPKIGKGTLFCLSATNQAQLKIDDSKFLGGPSIGLIAQSRVRIANSSFRGYGGPAILLAPDLEHMRGPAVENVHVNDCSFAECDLAPGEKRGAITVDTQPDYAGDSKTSVARVNEGITLQRNIFSKLGGPAIYCAGATWLDVESNRFDDYDQRRPAGTQPRAIVLRNLDESTVAANEANVPGQIVLIDCTEKVKVGDNGPLTNAIS